MTIKELLAKRGNIIQQMRDMVDKAEAENRDTTDEENTQYDAMNADQMQLKARADRMHRTAQLERESNEIIDPANALALKANDAPQGSRLATPEYRDAFFRYARVGGAALDHQFSNALQIGTDAEGGYITPEEFETQLTAALDEFNVLRPIVNVMSTASDRNIPVESTRGVATWTAEEAAYTESDPVFGQVVLGAHKLGRIIKVSEELLQDAFFDISSYLAENFGRSFAEAEESAFANGDGSGKPTGIVQGSTLGVTAASNAAITSDELIDLFHALKRPYRARAYWFLRDSTAKLIRKLKDGDSQYIWQPGLVAGQPDRIFARPIAISEGIPAVAAEAKSIVFGDPTFYRVADRQGRVMQRLNELYAANGQVGFRMYQRIDGQVTLGEAFQHLVHPA